MGKHRWLIDLGYCDGTRYHYSLTENAFDKPLGEHILHGALRALVLLGNAGLTSHSTLANIKGTGADADRGDKLASRLLTTGQYHAKHYTEPPSHRENQPRTQTQFSAR